MFDPVKKRSSGSSSDIISNLPNQLIESIIACLPIRDAVRTSILSTKWKDKWVTLPHLVFDDNTFKGTSVDPQAELMTNEVEVIKVISEVLLQHSGPVLKFVLSISNLASCPSIDHWLDFVSRNGIEDLTLKTRTRHQMPSSLLFCQSLRHLTLENCCIVRGAPTFRGFKKLTSVKFVCVVCDSKSLENLIANSPLLEKLDLCCMLDCHSLTVNAPNLKIFRSMGDSKFLCNINAPCLLKLRLGTYWHSGLPNHGEVNRSSNLFNLLGCLPWTLERLLNTYTSQLKNPPNTLSHLSELVLWAFSFEKLESVACPLCLVRNSPNLKIFVMHIKNSQIPLDGVEQVLTLMKAILGSSVKMMKLEYFKMTFMSGSKPEMEFIKFILASSPVLRKVTITVDRAYPYYNRFATLKELTSFSRASAAAKIIYSNEE